MRSYALSGLSLLAFAAPAAAQEARAAFDSPVVALDVFSRFENLLHLDADGDVDAFAVYWGNTDYDVIRVHGWSNDGSGGFTSAWPEMTAVAPGAPLPVHSDVGDLNGDGADDFVFTIGAQVYAYRTNAIGVKPGVFAAFQLFGEPDIGGVVLTDLSGGPEPEMVLITDDLYVYPNTGAGFGAPTILPLGLDSKALFAGDANGDAETDFFVEYGGAIQIIPVVGGVPSVGAALAHGITDPMPTMGDVDGDGDEDIVVFGMNGYVVARRVDDTTFVLEPLATGGPATGLADVDGDGDPDGVCCGGGGGGGAPTAYNVDASFFEIALNDGTGNFADAFAIPGLGAEKLAGAEDMDGDGDVDLVGGRCVYFNRGAIVEPPVLEVAQPTGYDHGVNENAIADADDDGDLDLQVGIAGMHANAADGSTTITSNLLLYTLAPNESVGSPGFQGDWDGDGDQDLIVSYSLDGTFVEMWLLANNGSGRFNVVGPAAAPGVNFNLQTGTFEQDRSEYAVTGDVDADGDVDLVTRRSMSGPKSQIWLNDGDGFFTAGAEILNWNVEAIADLTGDNVPDFVTFALAMTVFHGNGDGTYTGPVSLPGTTTMTPGRDRPVVEDMDGDGDVDLVSIHSFSGLGGVHWNDGSGNFTWEPWGNELLVVDQYEGFSVPRRVFALELNGDGKKDLVVYPSKNFSQQTAGNLDQHRSAWVVLRAGDGMGWEDPIRQIMDVSALADMDGDGDLDLVGDQVVRNTEWHGAGDGRTLQYGTGLAGSWGIEPILGGKGPFRGGNPAELRLRAALGGTFSWLAFSAGPGETPGFPVASTTTWIDLTTPTVILFPTIGGGPAEGWWTVPYVVPAVIGGLSFYHQAFTFDAGAPESVAASKGFRIDYGY